MIEAVIFDMDGTLVDSELLWTEIHHRMALLYNLQYSTEVRKRMMGKKDIEAAEEFRKYHNLTVSAEIISKQRKELLLENLHKVRIKEGLRKLLRDIDAFGLKKAVATSCFRDVSYSILTRLKLFKRFDIIITGDDVLKSKPDPTIFLEAARLLGVQPKNCIVIEDAEIGVLAASKAGMRCIAIPHEVSADHNFKLAQAVLPSLKYISKEILFGR